MAKITAKGKHAGVQLEVTCVKEDGELILDFDGVEDEFLEQEFRRELEKHHAIGGTFHPDTNSMINVLGVMQRYFFDGEPEITVDGDIGEEIPYEDDVIY